MISTSATMGDDSLFSRRTWIESLALSFPAFRSARLPPMPPQQQPGQPYASIRDYGAVGDGTTDDAAAFLKGLDATRASGATLFLPPGRYRCGRLIQAKTPCRIAGAGEQSQLVFDRDLPFGPPFRSLFIEGPRGAASGENSCQLRDFALTGQSNGPEGRATNELLAGIGVQYVSGHLDGLTVRQSWGMAIVYHACHDLTIRRCHVVRSGRDGITGFWKNQRVWIMDNVIQEPGDDGIALNAADEKVGGSLAEDIYIAGNQIENGRFFGRGIYLAGVGRAHVVDNSVRSVVSSGIAVTPSLLTDARSTDVEIIGNRVSYVGAAESQQPLVGIRLDSSDRVRILNNVVEASGTEGVFALHCGDVVLSGNSIARWGRTKSAPALDFRSIQRLTIMGNHVADGSGPGILLEAPATARVLGNFITTDYPNLLRVRGAVSDAIACGNLFVCTHADLRTAFEAETAGGEAFVLAANTIITAKGSRREFHPALRVSSNDVVDSER